MSQSSETANKDSDNHDYSGEVKFDSYETPAGEYKPVTRTERVQNVPKPTRSQNIDDETIAGLYSTIGYYMAALKYMAETKDFEPIGVMTGGNNNQFSAMAQQFKNTWYGNLQVTNTLKTTQPTKYGTLTIGSQLS